MPKSNFPYGTTGKDNLVLTPDQHKLIELALKSADGASKFAEKCRANGMTVLADCFRDFAKIIPDFVQMECRVKRGGLADQQPKTFVVEDKPRKLF